MASPVAREATWSHLAKNWGRSIMSAPTNAHAQIKIGRRMKRLTLIRVFFVATFPLNLGVAQTVQMPRPSVLDVPSPQFNGTYASTVEVKGIRIGMWKTDYDLIFPHGTEDFTIAGVRTFSITPTFAYHLLDTLVVSFPSSGFDTIRAALQNKYPGMKCADSSVANGFGATFAQTTCLYNELTLSRYSYDIKHGSLMLTRPVSRQQEEAAASKARSDI